MEKKGSSRNPGRPEIPFGQIFLDDMFLLLMVGIVVPFIIYMAWGYIDIGSVPPLPESHLAITPSTASSTPAVDGSQLVLSMGCIGCHTIDGSARVGPSWKGLFGQVRTLSDGTQVLADESYIRTSLLDPNAQIAQGFQPSLMPTFVGKLTDEEIDAIIEYIKELQ